MATNSRFPLARAAFDTLADAGGLSAPTPQIIEFRAAHLALAHDLYRIHDRAVDGKYALHAFAIGKLAHGEALVQPLAGAADADALESLKALARLGLLGLLVISRIDHT